MKTPALRPRLPLHPRILAFSLAFLFSVAFKQNSFAQQYNYGTGNTSGNPTITGSMTTSGTTVTITSSGNIPGGIYNFANLTINSGVTLTATGTTPVIIRCTGTFALSGMITATGATGGAGSKTAGGTGGTAVAGGDAGGNGGFNWENAGSPGSAYGSTPAGGGPGSSGNATTYADGGGGGGYATAGIGGGTKTAGQTSGGAGGSTYGNNSLSTNVTGSTPLVPINGPVGTIYLCGGSGGGGGCGDGISATNTADAAGGGGGGGGGGEIDITANTITIGSTGGISVAGGAGGAGYYNSGLLGYAGGGGGGSGGTISLQYFSYTNSGSSNLIVNGGTGGIPNNTTGNMTKGNGGAGAVGYSYLQQDQSLCTQPSANVSGLSTSVISGTQVNVTFTTTGTGGVIIVARASATAQAYPLENTAYTTTTYGSGSGSQLTGTGNYVVYNSTSTGTISAPVTGLTAGTTYSFDVYDYNSTGPCYFYPASTTSASPACAPPAKGAAWDSPGGITTSQTNISFTRGNGSGGVIVLASTSPISTGPTSGDSYSAGSTFTGSTCAYAGSGASQIGSAYVVYTNAVAGDDATEITTTVTGLTAGTIYYFSIYEFSVTSNCYVSTGTTGNITTESQCSGTPTTGTAAAVSSTLCPNGSTTINLTGYTTGVGSIVFQWQQSTTGLSGSWSNVSGGSGATTTSYTTPALTNAGTSVVTYYYNCLVTCQASSASATSNTVSITVSPAPSLTINGSNAYSTSACNGAGVALSVVDNASDGGSTYSWSPNSTISPGNTSANVTVTPAGTTTYTVTGTANGCTATATATAAITVNPTAINFSPASPVIGIGGNVSITASATSGNGTITNYVWSPTNTLNVSSGATATANPLSATVYTVTATDPGGCSITGTVTVNVTSGTLGTVVCSYSPTYVGGSAYTHASSLGTPTSLTWSQNTVYPGNNIGFSFAFDDNYYTQVGISSNGFIWFGTGQPSASEYNPLSDATGQTGNVDGIVSVFGQQLYTYSGSTAISYIDTGTAPNQVCIIEWRAVGIDPNGSYSASEEDFEIRLYQATGNIELWYNTAPYNITYVGVSGIYGGEVGIRGSGTSDYNTRSIGCSSGQNWSTSSLGTNSSICEIDGGTRCSGGQWPVSGDNFRYTPTAKPTITPTSQQNICTGGSGVTLTAVNSGNMSSPAYQWQVCGSPNSNINGQTGTTYNADPSTPGNYFYTVQLTSGSCTRYSAPEALVLSAPPNAYNVTGSGCSSTNIGLSGSDIGVNYQLVYDGSTNIGSTIAGTGSALAPSAWNGITTAGTYTIVGTNPTSGCSSVTMTGSAVLVSACCTTDTWQGGTSTGGGPTDWFTGANWSCGIVPTSGTDVLIPAELSNYPVVSGTVGETAYVRNLTIQNGASINVQGVNGVMLQVYGNITDDNATSSLGGGEVAFGGSSAQTITGNNTFTNMMINNSNGVTIAAGTGNMQYISGTLILQKGTLTTNGNLTITSTSSGTGEIDDFSGTNQGSISGTLTVQRYVVNPTPSHTTGISYYFIGSPVNGATISQWNNEFTNTLINGATDGSYVIPTASCSDVNLASNSPYGGLFDYNESVVTTCNQSGWQVRNSGTIPRGQGFAGQVPNGTTLALTGTYNTGNISSPNLTVTSTNLTETPGYGWNLVSNPYVSPIHWLNVASANSNLSGSVYTYIASGSMAGTYNTVNELTYEENGLDQVGTSEAFWVEATTNNSAISFTNSMRSDGNNAFLRTAPSWEQMLSLKVSGNGYNDQVRVAFGSKFTDGFDNGYDAHKLLGNSVQPNVYVTDNVAKYCIYAIPTVAQDERDIPVAFTAGTSGQFSFTADLNGFDPTALVFLEDLQTHTIQNLMVSSTYSFTANTSDDAARFVLHFLPAATFTFTPADCNGQNGLFTASMGEYSVAGMPVKWTTYTLTASDNNIVAAGNFENNSISFTNLPGGYYTLELNMNGYTASKVIQLVNEQQVAATFVPSELTAQVGDDILFANNTTGATGYSWQFGDGAISDAVSPTHSYASAGSYQVVLTATNPDCSGTFEKTIEVASTTGINNVQAETARITGYANDVNIEFSGFTTVDEVTVNIYDLTGRKLITPQNIPTGDSKHTIQLDDIATGYYFVVLTGGNYEKAGKVFLGNNH